jgi:hypothetical protein
MTHSQSLAQLAAAYVTFQAEVQNPAKTAANPHYKSTFAPLNEVLEYARPLLSKHGLALIQTTTQAEGTAFGVVVTTLLHISGEYLSGQYPLHPAKLDPQGVASAVSYARRYALMAMLGIAGDDDDDGNAAAGLNPASSAPSPTRRPTTPAPTAKKPVVPPPVRINGAATHPPATLAANAAPVTDKAEGDPGDFIVPVGSRKGKALKELPPRDVCWYAEAMQPTTDDSRALVAAAQAYLQAHPAVREAAIAAANGKPIASA